MTGPLRDRDRIRSRRRARPVAWIVTSLLAVAALAVSWLGLDAILHGPMPADAPPAAEGAPGGAAPAPTPTVAIDISTPSSPSVLVGPRYPLAPLDYAPASLVTLADISLPSSDGVQLSHDAAYALLHLFADARYNRGFDLSVARGYVSAADQAALFERASATAGPDAAERSTGQPGHDEHQTGFAADLALAGSDCSLAECFADTDAGEWLAEHAVDYGFLVRYPVGTERATGHAAAPYQLRYFGEELAAQIHASGSATYEQYLGLPNLG